MLLDHRFVLRSLLHNFLRGCRCGLLLDHRFVLRVLLVLLVLLLLLVVLVALVVLLPLVEAHLPVGQCVLERPLTLDRQRLEVILAGRGVRGLAEHVQLPQKGCFCAKALAAVWQGAWLQQLGAEDVVEGLHQGVRHR